MARKTKKSKSGKISLDFKGVQTRVLLPENDYRLKPTGLEEEGDQLKMTFEIVKGKFEGKTTTEYFSTKPQALWRFGNFIAACGLEVPDGEIELDASDFEDVEVMGICTHDEYEGKPKMRWDFYPVDEADGGEDEGEDEDDKKSSKSKKSSKKVEKVSEDEVNEADEDGLAEIIENTGIDCDLDDYKGIKKKRAAVIEALTEAELLDDGEEDEPEEDKKSSKKSGKSSSKKGGKKKVESSAVEDMDEDELGELIEEHELEVDLDDYKTLRKKVRAVLDALEEKDLLEE